MTRNFYALLIKAEGTVMLTTQTYTVQANDTLFSIPLARTEWC
jgi:hypothetical protein